MHCVLPHQQHQHRVRAAAFHAAQRTREVLGPQPDEDLVGDHPVAQRRVAPRGLRREIWPHVVVADDAPASERPTKGSITVPYGRGATGYTYDPATNSYLRSVSGKAQKDAADGQRVTARNVVVLWMALSIDPESEVGHKRPALAQIGKGTAWVFRDGKVIKGTWRKKDQGGLTSFFDASGNEISLVRGRIFIQVVATGTKVTYDAAE